MSDRVQIATLVVGCITTVFAAPMPALMLWLNIRAREAAAELDKTRRSARRSARRADVKVDRVRRTLEENTTSTEVRLDDLATVAKATHLLVNSKMSVQLDANRIMARRLADLTKDPADEAAAELAERDYGEHQAKQAAVDAQPGTDAEKKGERP
jgi:hypothetical protein